MLYNYIFEEHSGTQGASAEYFNAKCLAMNRKDTGLWFLYVMSVSMIRYHRRTPHAHTLLCFERISLLALADG